MYHWAQKGRSRESRRSGESIPNPDFLAFEKGHLILEHGNFFQGNKASQWNV